MDFDETPVYIPVEDVADLLGVSQRQATRYAKKVRTQQDGRRIMYHRADVEKLAQERGAKHDRPLAVHTEVIPPGRLLDIITQQQQDNMRISRENGELAERLKAEQQRADQAEQAQRKLLEDSDETSRQMSQAQARATTAEAEAERLRLELERLRRSWWRRLFSK
jgi:regulator of replication initiation timing